MKDLKLYYYWLCLFIISAALGFIPDRGPLAIALLALLSLGFFVPGGMLLYRAVKRGDRKQLTRVALISLGSLVITTALFVANMATATAPDNQALGTVLYVLLAVFSAPMFCAPYYVVSLFLWACLLFAAISYRKQTKSAKDTKK